LNKKFFFIVSAIPILPLANVIIDSISGIKGIDSEPSVPIGGGIILKNVAMRNIYKNFTCFVRYNYQTKYIYMAKSRHRKKHKKKVNARKQKVIGDKNRVKRVQREMYEQIMLEMQNGEFDGTFNVPTEGEENTEINETDNDIELEL
jgi:hypothetical protein